MLPLANLHLKELYDSTVEYLGLRSPTFSFSSFSSQYTDSGPSTPRDLSPDPPVARRLDEFSILRDKLDAAERRHCPSACSCRSFGASAAGTTFHAMRREHDTTKIELARSLGELAKLEDRCRQLERTLNETRELVRARDTEIERLRKENERIIIQQKSREQSRVERPRSGHRRSQDSVQSLSTSAPSSSFSIEQAAGGRYTRHESESHNSSIPLASIMNGSQDAEHVEVETNSPAVDNISSTAAEEGAQLKSQETFMTKVDLWSGAQVIQTLEDLNSEILQFAASATDLCVFAKPPLQPTTKLSLATAETMARFGPSLCRLLSTRDHSQDPMLVQLALQGCVSMCVYRATSSFYFGHHPKVNGMLAEIYSHVFQNEPQPTSGRWRALTHKHINDLHPHMAENSVMDLVETIFRWSLDLFLISGSANPQTAPSSPDSFRNRFSAQVQRIATAACRVARATREDILSTNFEIVAIENGKIFDHREMVDPFQDYGQSKGTVLCTTELGLMCSTRRSGGGLGRLEQDSFVERRMLLRPKVILESAVEVLDPR